MSFKKLQIIILNCDAILRFNELLVEIYNDMVCVQFVIDLLVFGSCFRLICYPSVHFPVVFFLFRLVQVHSVFANLKRESCYLFNRDSSQLLILYKPCQGTKQRGLLVYVCVLSFFVESCNCIEYHDFVSSFS